MNAAIQGVPLSALFTPITREPLKEKDAKKINSLSAAVLALAIERLKKGALACFDAHVGDFGCERYALSVYKLAIGQAIKDECRAIEAERGNPPEKILVSKDLAFLLQCFLLRQVRETVKKKDSEEEEFVCKPAKIKSLVTGINGDLCRKIVCLFQTRVSGESVERVKQETETSTVLAPLEKERIVEVLSPPYLNVEKQLGGIVTRCFSDTYYTQKAVIVKLRELCVPVLIKKMVKIGERPCGTLFIPKSKEGPFVPVDKAALPPNTPLVVIEGDYKTGLGPEEVREKIARIGLEEVVLSTCAQYSPEMFQKDEEVKTALEKMDERECNKKNSPFFYIDHVFCSSLAEEAQEGDIV